MNTTHRLALVLVAALLCLGAAGCSSNAGTAACALNSDCPGLQNCIRGSCVPECREDRDCNGGGRCVNEVCVDGGPVDAGDVRDGGTVTIDIGGEIPADDVETPDTRDADAVDVRPDTGPRPEGSGAVTGRVHFRLYDDTDVAVAEPVVYWTLPEAPPAPLRRGATCDCDFPAHAVRGDIEGRFVLDGVPAGDVLLVVQKGRFRRVRTLNVAADATTDAPAEHTELPALHDPGNGDEVPNIVIGTGRFDPIEDVFAKLRMLPITGRFGVDYRAYLDDPAAWPITLMHYQPPGEFDRDELSDLNWAASVPPYLDLLGDFDRLRTYDFAFSPCASTQDYGSALTSAAVRESIRSFVNEGGNLYVTDYAYDVVEQVFPEYIDFTAPDQSDRNADGLVGQPARMAIATHDARRYESPNRAQTPALRQWLFALGAATDGLVQTHGNWVNVKAAGGGDQCCRDGAVVTVPAEVVMNGPNYVKRTFSEGVTHDSWAEVAGVTHDSWAEAEAAGANHPHTLRFPYGCGEVMYSTYHTTEYNERNANLTPQELVLLYLILELNMCAADPVKE